MNNTITIGADPELFIINSKTNKVVSSIGLIPGKKHAAWRLKDWPRGFGLETDNILAEFNIPPAKTRQEFIDGINFMKNFIREFVKKKNPEYDIKTIASLHVDESELGSDEAKEFGCSVDYNAYTEAPNPKPKGETTNLRSAGFHVHFGYPNRSAEATVTLIKYFDAYLGVPSVLLDRDMERRILYGKAGCFRLTPYGGEYRVLSSFFLSNDSTIGFVYDGAIRALTAYYAGIQLPPADDVVKCINEGNAKLAVKLIDNYKLNKLD
jgi:hypothetical protein